jgi:DNA modification methylase
LIDRKEEKQVTQKSLPLHAKSYVFACTNSSQEECFRRLLFGSSRVYGAAAMRVKKGDFLFLWNLDSDFLYGVFRAVRDAQYNAVPEAWGGKYPYQVQVEPIGRITPLKDAKKLLDSLKVERSSPISCSKTITILELYRPSSLSFDKWFERLVQANAAKDLEISSEAKSWSLLAHVKKTDEVIDELPKLQSTTLWDFPRQSYGRSPKGNNKYAGVTPAELIWNLVWRYTEPGDLVVDPMCGSGTTLDVCKEEGRRAICYDVSPPLNRTDIIRNDARRIPLPDNHVDMVFIDSPYGDNIRYNEDPNCIGKISSESEEFYDELEKVIRESYRILKPGKVLDWLIGDQWVKKKFTPVGFLLYARLTKYFDTVDLICIARRNQSSNTGIWANRARRFNFYLRGFKYLFIMRKPIPGQKKVEEPREITWTYYRREKPKKPD